MIYGCAVHWGNPPSIWRENDSTLRLGFRYQLSLTIEEGPRLPTGYADGVGRGTSPYPSLKRCVSLKKVPLETR